MNGLNHMSKPNYILYCRKSTEDKGRQILSLDSQENEMKRVAKNLGLNIVNVLKESKSAKKPNNRPEFQKLIEIIESGGVDGVLCWKIDRLSRNPMDSGKIQWLLQEEKLKSIQTYDREYLSDDNAVIMSVESSVANQYIRDLSKNVKRGLRAKLEKGEWPNLAPIGYANDRLNKTILIDKEKSIYIAKAFELYSTGAYSYSQVSDNLYEQGFRYDSGKKVYKSAIQRIINNTFYYGVMERDGKYYIGNHKPIITKDLFDKTQEAIKIKLHPKKKTQFFTYRGFLKCEKCGCMLTATRKKKIHTYYYCTNGKGQCDECKKYLKGKDVDELMSEVLSQLSYNDEIFDIAFKAYKVKYEKNIQDNGTIKQNLQNQLKMLVKKEARLLDIYLSEKVPDEVYEAKSKQIKADKIDIELQISTHSNTSDNGESTLEQVKNVFFEAKLAKKKLLDGNDEEKRILLEKLLWNATIEDKKITNFKFKLPYSLIQKNTQKGDFLY